MKRVRVPYYPIGRKNIFLQTARDFPNWGIVFCSSVQITAGKANATLAFFFPRKTFNELASVATIITFGIPEKNLILIGTGQPVTSQDPFVVVVLIIIILDVSPALLSAARHYRAPVLPEENSLLDSSE